MGKTLERELEDVGVDMDADLFRDLLGEMVHVMYRNWNDEQLKDHPVEAIKYCATIRHELKKYDLPDDFILRNLTNARKSGHISFGKVGVEN